MCFNIKTPKQIAKNAITVYKVMYEGPRSYFKDFTYELNKLYSTRFTFSGLTRNPNYPWPHFSRKTIYHGFHSYATLPKGKRYYDNLWEVDCVDLYECTIPKGATYYHNYDEEMVSDQIIINRKYHE